MKKLILLLLCFTPFIALADSACYSVCKEWDTFCKSPKQLIATKCRLGVPVKHEQCDAIGIPSRYLVRGGGSLVEARPCTADEEKENKINEV